ncbi:uncharacterized protein LOC128265300 [Drosophila gunungcola]|uniref:Uncharacterized protein n=1 Tax=Drosophila gunungcola TaxID=103775 RepID=A0A9Q0BJ21_9MUSC|nr:uncharacterized protein LOC128265300 [Drosophila gunungcola]XP_052857181.1 uncharacterized protein LOC128265300 [Drosophila gunungcola]XP_052857182.1 uncharacterized protein LOC128265300 [Drosophila gunungcola]KAI8033711.1 hypothetical protein M5D96_013534 [Drosophila gunungcola]
MSDNSAVSTALNVLLCGATGFGLYKIGPSEHPYAFTACMMGFCHGLGGLVSGLTGDENAKKVTETTTGFMEIIPLPLVNVNLYLAAESNNIALGHGLFIVPLAVGVILNMVKGESGDDSEGGVLETLKTLTVLGNITSLLYLSINESSWNLTGMALLAFMAKFGAKFCEEQVCEGSGEPVSYVSWSGFFFLTALAASGEK